MGYGTPSFSLPGFWKGYNEMNVSLVWPPITGRLAEISILNFPPLGLSYLAAAIRDKHRIHVFNCQTEKPRLHQVPSSPGIFALGATPSQVAQSIVSHDADVVAISCLYTHQIVGITEIVRAIRHAAPQARIILGGGYPTVFTEKILDAGIADIIVTHEGDRAFVALLDALENNTPLVDVKGIAFRDENGRAIRNAPAGYIENLDTLPFPALDLFKIETYFNNYCNYLPSGHRRTVVIMTSRGCTYRCSFCYSTVHWGHRYRVQSSPRTLAEIQHVVEDFGAREIHILDDNFFVKREVAERVMEGIPDVMPEPRWALPGGVGVRYIDEPLVRKLKDTGCHQISVAIESANQSVLNEAKKPVNVEEIHDKIKPLNRYRIETYAFFMVGFPGETRKSIYATATLARKLPVRTTLLTVVSPLPGTPYFEEFRKRHPKDFDSLILQHNYYRPVITLCEMTPDELGRVIRNNLWYNIVRRLTKWDFIHFAYYSNRFRTFSVFLLQWAGFELKRFFRPDGQSNSSTQAAGGLPFPMDAPRGRKTGSSSIEH